MSGPPLTPIAERFWPKVDIPSPFHCWEWKAARAKNGYGKIGRGGHGQGWVGAHRVSYELLRGSIPEGLQLDHLCRNRACVNPAHLEAVPCRTNLLRGVSPAAENARKDACTHGHPFDSENTYEWRGQRHCRTCRREADRRRT